MCPIHRATSYRICIVRSVSNVRLMKREKSLTRDREILWCDDSISIQHSVGGHSHHRL